MHTFTKTSLAFATAMAMMSTPAAYANIVKNPSFEQYDAGWIFNGVELYQYNEFAHSGELSVGSTCAGHSCVSTENSGAFIQQRLNTVAGGTYDLSFYVGEDRGPTSELSVFWNGVLLADILNPANNTQPDPGMILFSFTGLLATDTLTTLEVHARHDRGVMHLDDFVVEESKTTIPEPSTFALMALGLACTLMSRRRLN